MESNLNTSGVVESLLNNKLDGVYRVVLTEIEPELKKFMSCKDTEKARGLFVAMLKYWINKAGGDLEIADLLAESFDFMAWRIDNKKTPSYLQTDIHTDLLAYKIDKKVGPARTFLRRSINWDMLFGPINS